MKNWMICFVLLFAAFSVHAQPAGEITGKVIDAETGEPLQGANIVLKGTTIGASSDAAGFFRLVGLADGTYELLVSYVGYQAYSQQVVVKGEAQALRLQLEPGVLQAHEVVVTALRAREGETPIAFTNISAVEIRAKNWGQEIPLLLSDVPGVYSYSQTGSGLGYAEVKIRGFDATRVAVTINGVPLNDPEDHVTYFYDLPDIASNVQNIQVQRGVGNSLYGSAAIGGSISILTQTAEQSPGMTVYAGFGSFNTKRYNFSYNSGILNKKYSVYGRFSKIKSDGYRRDAWVDSWSGFFSASRFDKKMTTTINVFTGPVRAHFAWSGITAADLATDRRLNYDSPEFNGNHRNIVDDFLQTHYQLLNSWQLGTNTTLQNTFFHVRGEGFFESFKFSRKFAEYNLPPFDINGGTINRTDLVRQKWVSKKQYGWIPRLRLAHARGTFTAGGELSLFDAHHWGQVTWARTLPQEVPPDHKYYEYYTDKLSATAFVNEITTLSPATRLVTDLQFTHHTYDFDQTRIGAYRDKGYAYTLNYNFISPRVGLVRELSAAVNGFANFSVARREPKDRDIYDADDPDVFPAFQRTGTTIDFDRPTIKAETLYQFELGLDVHRPAYEAKVNVYWMDFRNEIVPSGGVDDDGLPVFGNADRSVHRGVEVAGAYRMTSHFSLSANASFSDNTFREYTEFGFDENWQAIPLDRQGNKIAGFPNYILNARLSYENRGLQASFSYCGIGRQYLDNSESDALSIGPYTVFDFGVRYRADRLLGLRGLVFDLKVNNFFNSLHETHGYAYDDAGADGKPVRIGAFVPAADRNVFFGTSVEF